MAWQLAWQEVRARRGSAACSRARSRSPPWRRAKRRRSGCSTAAAEPENWLTHHKDYAATAIFHARRDQQGHRAGPQGRLGLCARRHRGRRHLAARRSRGHADRRGRRDVRHRRLGLGLQARYQPGSRQAHVEDGPGHRQGLVGRGLVLRREQPRRRALAGQGDLAHPGRPAARDRQGNGRGRVGTAGRGSGDRRGHHRGAARGQGSGHHRRVGGGVRHPRLDRRDRPEHRRGGLAPAHHPRAGRPGHETWPDDTTPGRRGGSTWVTGSYDPEHQPDQLGRGQPRPRLGR